MFDIDSGLKQPAVFVPFYFLKSRKIIDVKKYYVLWAKRRLEPNHQSL